MSAFRKKPYILPLTTCLLSLCLCLPVTGNAQDEPSEKALAAIVAAIDEVREEISRRNAERATTWEAMQDTEQRLLATAADIASVEARIRDNEARLQELRAEQAGLESRKTGQQGLISQYLRSAYQTGRQEYFKLLLNQENPALSARTLRYYQYFNEARSTKIREFNDTLDALQAVQTTIADTTRDLNEQETALAGQQATLQASMRERQAMLDDLDVKLSASGKKLADLEAEREEMELLLEELRRSVANLSLGGQQEPFASLKGHLPWPVEGRLANAWGSRYGAGDLRWEGVTIAAGEGTQVRAVHHGRVVFADWFSSSGLLLIIDHGDGYMSLYAHNQALFKDVGEWVGSGEIIAAVGNTGGQADYGLYFEIRHNGESENPSAWCLARN